MMVRRRGFPGAAAAFLLVNLTGVAAFAAPFLVGAAPAAAGRARSEDAPWLVTLLVPMLIAVAITQTSGGRLNSKAIALLGVLTACAALLRLPFSFAGANLFFVLPITAAMVFGARFGFLLGSLGLAASALVTGGVGPWLPFQMWAAGWVGAGAGLLRGPSAVLGKTAGCVLLPAIYGWAAAFFYGIVINLYFWPVAFGGDSPIGWRPGLGWSATVAHYVSFYSVTSLAWDAVGAMFNLVLLSIFGKPLIELMRRYRQRFSFELTQAPAAG